MLFIMLCICWLPGPLSDGSPVTQRTDITTPSLTNHLEQSERPANACMQTARRCTASGNGNFTGCQPQKITQYRQYFIANTVAIISIGATTNILTLMAIPYGMFK